MLRKNWFTDSNTFRTTICPWNCNQAPRDRFVQAFYYEQQFCNCYDNNLAYRGSAYQRWEHCLTADFALNLDDGRVFFQKIVMGPDVPGLVTMTTLKE